jgi:hypothetical protein
VRTQRIKTGFHRLGTAIACIFGAPGVLSVAAAIPAYWGWFGSERELWQLLLALGALAITLSAASYAAAWTLGWIVAGFFGDSNSN